MTDFGSWEDFPDPSLEQRAGLGFTPDIPAPPVGLGKTAMGAAATATAQEALTAILKQVAGKVLREALDSTAAGDEPVYRSVPDHENPSWADALLIAVQEATTAELMASIQPADPADDEWDAKPPALIFPTLMEWVHNWLAPMYRRRVDGRGLTWCSQWWEHQEAVYRLSALWRGFEQRRTEPGDAVSAWIRDHLDYHMGVILDADTGPFQGCSPKDGHTTRPLQPLPTQEPPPALADFFS